MTAAVGRPQRALSRGDASARRGIGSSLMYELIGSGQVASIRVGRLRRVPPESLTEYVATMRRQAQRPGPAA